MIEIQTIQQFFLEMRKAQFVAYVNDQNQPIIRDQLERSRRLPENLFQYAKANRNAVIAFLQNEDGWTDEAGCFFCRQCKAEVVPANLDGSIVASCEYKPQCPFWFAEQREYEPVD